MVPPASRHHYSSVFSAGLSCANVKAIQMIFNQTFDTDVLQFIDEKMNESVKSTFDII